jgi:putative ABC transport system ATP-binding protein
MLEAQAVSKYYPHSGGKIEVLNELTFKVGDGEKVAIIGPSGSGKSTLLSLLAGLDRPTNGSIKVNNDDIAVMTEQEVTAFRAKNIGIVFQQFHLMSHFTALENVALPLQIAGNASPWDAAEEALKAVGLGARLRHFPFQMSGGECQRVAIARAMVGRPPLILADEPSGNLDVNTGNQVMDLLFDVLKESSASLILVTHNEDLAKKCDRVLSLKAGKLVHD